MKEKKTGKEKKRKEKKMSKQIEIRNKCAEREDH